MSLESWTSSLNIILLVIPKVTNFDVPSFSFLSSMKYDLFQCHNYWEWWVKLEQLLFLVEYFLSYFQESLVAKADIGKGIWWKVVTVDASASVIHNGKWELLWSTGNIKRCIRKGYQKGVCIFFIFLCVDNVLKNSKLRISLIIIKVSGCSTYIGVLDFGQSWLCHDFIKYLHHCYIVIIDYLC